MTTFLSHPDVLAALGLLRVEELREEIRAELEAAAEWKVTASRGMTVKVGPHVLHLHPSYPTRGRIDLVHVALASTGVLRVAVACGTPGAIPMPPVMTQTGSLVEIPLAYVHVHAGAWVIYSHCIVPIAPEDRVAQ